MSLRLWIRATTVHTHTYLLFSSLYGTYIYAINTRNKNPSLSCSIIVTHKEARQANYRVKEVYRQEWWESEWAMGENHCEKPKSGIKPSMPLDVIPFGKSPVVSPDGPSATHLNVMPLQN